MKTSISVASISILLLCVIALPAFGGSKEDGAVDLNQISKYQKAVNNDPITALQINAITNNGIRDLSLNRELLLTHNKLFNYSLKSAGVTNQKSSGRCWMFAAFNVFSPDVATKLKMSKFELSESWLAFWDKVEKANLFLEDMIRLADRPINDRELQGLLESPIGDGGWWHYFTGLVEKYGVVPKSAMPETKQSSSTGMLNKLATSKLRGYASELRQMHADGKSLKDMRKRKEVMLGDIYKILVYTYGTPPSEFTLRWKPTDDKEEDSKSGDDKSLPGQCTGTFDNELDVPSFGAGATENELVADDKKGDEKDEKKSDPKIIERQFTPRSFYDEFFGGSLPDYIALANVPTREYGKLYQIETSRNIYEDEDYVILNLPIERLKHYATKALLDSQVVWFACDVGQQNYSDSGIFMDGIYDYNTTFGMDFHQSKADRINFKDVSPNHAMVFMGIDTTDDGSPRKWLVENSWGSKKGDQGNWYMYDNWFDEYVFVTIIDKSQMEETELEMLRQKPTMIEAWDPFFTALRRVQ